ncbi:hypothetical protein VNO78_02447 [Psophocarpus tetragonolobus]|uniref:Uncharacterized protein n=1 Tax=Psophocarpus tetragonolobus TaxID=3891 RepID=A0AAN9XV36_PSOTE
MALGELLALRYTVVIWRNGRTVSIGNEDELLKSSKWLDRWVATKPWENKGRDSTNQGDPLRLWRLTLLSLISRN